MRFFASLGGLLLLSLSAGAVFVVGTQYSNVVDPSVAGTAPVRRAASNFGLGLNSGLDDYAARLVDYAPASRAMRLATGLNTPGTIERVPQALFRPNTSLSMLVSIAGLGPSELARERTIQVHLTQSRAGPSCLPPQLSNKASHCASPHPNKLISAASKLEGGIAEEVWKAGNVLLLWRGARMRKTSRRRQQLTPRLVQNPLRRMAPSEYCSTRCGAVYLDLVHKRRRQDSPKTATPNIRTKPPTPNLDQSKKLGRASENLPSPEMTLDSALLASASSSPSSNSADYNNLGISSHAILSRQNSTPLKLVSNHTCG
ncbi:hypothetical protein DFH06DRAFT_1119163 [Mycena polygramma]|nr:hypothetical protein DFH06DRAFT_1119163 [Mycena polygramma]